jgi:hypothetical protein
MIISYACASRTFAKRREISSVSHLILQVREGSIKQLIIYDDAAISLSLSLSVSPLLSSLCPCAALKRGSEGKNPI